MQLYYVAYTAYGVRCSKPFMYLQSAREWQQYAEYVRGWPAYVAR
jgi:hypothetical protein